MDKSTIVQAAVNYIRHLQSDIQILHRQKIERLRLGGMADSTMVAMPVETLMESREAFLADQGPPNVPPPSFPVPVNPGSFQTWYSPNVVMNLSGGDAQINVCSVNKPGLVTIMLQILRKHNLYVLSAHLSADHHRCMYMIHIRVSLKNFIG